MSFDTRKIADEPKLLYWEVRCSDKTLYCASNIMMDVSYLAKDLMEEFGSSHNILELPLFSSDIVSFLLNEYMSYRGDYNDKSPEQIIKYIECMRYLQFPNSTMLTYIQHFLNTYEMTFDFVYYYYQHKYLDIKIDYPWIYPYAESNLGEKHLLGFLEKIVEILENFSDVQKFYNDIYQKVETQLDNNPSSIDLDTFTSSHIFGTSYVQPYRFYNNIVRTYLMNNYDCSKGSWDQTAIQISKRFPKHFESRLGAGRISTLSYKQNEENFIKSFFRVYFNLPLE